MSNKIVAQDSRITIGVDVHTDSHVIAVRKEKDFIDCFTIQGSKSDWDNYLERFPGCEMVVIYEAGPNGYNLHDWLVELNGKRGQSIKVVVAPPSMVPEAAAKKKIKTDKRDAKKLVIAYESGSFRPVIVPDKNLRSMRQLVRLREQFVKDTGRIRNRIHGFIKQHGLNYPTTPRWAGEWKSELLAQAKQLDSQGHLFFTLSMQFKQLEMLKRQKSSTDKRIKKLFVNSPIKEKLHKLTRQIGIGWTSAAIIASETADFNAFDNSNAFASYTGLVSGVRATGKTVHRGPITKVGNKRLRRVFVECAWVWVRYDKEAARQFYKLKARRGPRRAIVAFARKLAVRVYHQIVNNAPATTTMCVDRPG